MSPILNCPRRFVTVLVLATIGIVSYCCFCPSLVIAAGDQLPEVAPTTVSFREWVGGAFQQPLLLCFIIIALGMGLGSLRLFGLSLGASGVLFSALLLGHLGTEESWTLPGEIGHLGLVLFVYSVGLGAGPTFFRMFRNHGKKLALLSLFSGIAAVGTTVGLAFLLDIPGNLAAGIFAGAMTSTPGLASAVEAASRGGQSPSAVSIGFAMAYPIGVVATVLFVQILPKLMQIDFNTLAATLQNKNGNGDGISHHLIEVTNSSVFGKAVRDIKLIDRTGGQITRIRQGETMVPIRADHTFDKGQIVQLVADGETAEMITMLLGQRSDAKVVADTEQDLLRFVVTHKSMLGKPLRELHIRSQFGVTISRIERYGMSFVPSSSTSIAMADRVTAIGPPEGLKAFEQKVGHRARRLHETDLMSVGVGLVIGILIGITPIVIPGVGAFKFGFAGGPLIAGLLFAHFGRFLGVVGYMPTAARLLIQQLGLAFFLAATGFDAGKHFGDLIGEFGFSPFILAIAVAIVPLAVSYGVARYLLGLNALELLGGACGAMTSTAAIGAVTEKTDSDIPISSYAAAYPIALVMMTILTQIVLALLG